MTDDQMEYGGIILLLMIGMLRDRPINMSDKDIRKLLQRKCVTAAIEIDKGKQQRREKGVDHGE